MEAISASGLVKRYGGLKVLDGASLLLERGARAAVYGPTGCGKTTLLMVLAGLVRPEEGEVSLFGAKASGNGAFLGPEKRGLGVVFQKAVLWPHMNARRNVEFALCSSPLGRGEIRARALEALEVFDAAEFAERRPETLSGGQAQRVALARSIAARPRLLLWDEPFSGLDAASRDMLGERIRALSEQTGTTLVAVSHEREDAERLGARILVMRNGKLESSQ